MENIFPKILDILDMLLLWSFSRFIIYYVRVSAK